VGLPHAAPWGTQASAQNLRCFAGRHPLLKIKIIIIVKLSIIYLQYLTGKPLI